MVRDKKDIRRHLFLVEKCRLFCLESNLTNLSLSLLHTFGKYICWLL